MSADKPIFLPVHGSWHRPPMYHPLEQALNDRGFALVIPALPTMGHEATDVGWDADVRALLEHADALFVGVREVVLIGHSYGGIPACVATPGNDIAERKATGLSGGFRHIVFLCAFLIPAIGISLISSVESYQSGRRSQNRKTRTGCSVKS
ncbi:hypothetical protein GGR57DRAFT_186002 [Xylariaceae sp. FL1272]|nr:hypothetical protein GGR57DRAFT_186002 [Xylariaceae sp. FL1272]